MNEEEIRKNIYLLQRHQEQMEDTYAQIDMIERLIQEHDRTVETLQEMVEMEEGKEVLMPVGGNVFAKAAIKDAENVIVNVGGNVFIEKPINGAIDFIKEKIEELKKNEEKLVKMAEDIRQRMEEISQKIRKEDVQVS